MAPLLIMTVILIMGFCSFMVARKTFKWLDAKKNAWAVPISIVAFMAFFSVLAIIIFAICIYNMDFGR